MSADIQYDLIAPEPADVLAKLADNNDAGKVLDGFNPPQAEFALLKTRTDLWSPYIIKDAQARKLLSDLHKTTCAIECKGAAFCERENRTLA